MTWAGPSDGRRRSDQNIVALLSLKLLLLAFFILLNSLARFEEEKTRRVLESVQDTFDGKFQSVSTTRIEGGALGTLDRSRSLIQKLEALFKSELAVSEVEVRKKGNLFRLELPARQLFRDGESHLRRGRAAFLKRVSAALLDQQAAGTDFRVRVLYGVVSTAAPRFEVPSPDLLEIRRASRLIEELEVRDIARARLTLGIEPLLRDRVALEILLPDPVAQGAARQPAERAEQTPPLDG